MSDDYTLKYTDGYANYSGKINEAELEIDGECKIMNYDPRENPDKDSVKKGSISINFSDDEQTIEIGNGKELVSTEKANFSKKKYSIFAEIAALDGDAKELSVDDIKKMDKSLIEKWGLKDLRYDFRNGVATLVWGENDILRIDFKTWQERWFGESKYSKVKPSIEETTSNTVPKAAETNRMYVIKQGDTLEGIAHKHDLFMWEILAANPALKNRADTLSIGQEIFIPKSEVPKKYEDLSSKGQKFLAVLAAKESSNNKREENQVGYIGLYQMGEKALRTIGVYKEDDTPDKNTWEEKNWVKGNIVGIKNKRDFLNSEEKQHEAVIRYTVKNWIHIKTNVDLSKYVGKYLKDEKGNKTVLITEAGLLAGAHLVGAEDVVKYLESNGNYVPKDGNKKYVTEYIKLAQDEDVSDFMVL